MYKTLTKEKIVPLINKKDLKFIPYMVVSLLVGQGVLFNFYNPFAIGFLALFIGYSNIKFLLIYISLILGLTNSFDSVFLYAYTFSATCLLMSNLYFNHKNINISKKLKGIIAGSSLLIGGLIPVISYDFSIYFLFTFFVFSIFTLLLPTILSKGFMIFELKGFVKPLGSDEIISLSILFSSVILGGISIHNIFFDFNTFIIFLLILVFSYVSNSASGCVVALLLSIVPYFAGIITADKVVVFCLCGTIAGATKNDNKIKTIIGLIAGLTLSYLYITVSVLDTYFTASVILAMFLFYFLPDNYYTILQSSFGVVVDNSYNYGDKVKYYTSSKLNLYSNSFNKLSKTFKSLVVDKTKLNQEDIATVINNTVTRVCNECENKNLCWKTVFYTTYQTCTQIVLCVENKDSDKLEESIETFKKNCHKSLEFLEFIKINYSNLEKDIKWENKLSENKYLVAEQLEDVSNIFDNIIKNLNQNIIFLPNFEQIIINTLTSNGLPVDNVLVTQNDKNIYNVFIILDINIREKNAFKIIRDCVSHSLNKRVKIVSSKIMFNGKYEIYIEEVYKHKISYGVSMMNKNDGIISGDSYSTYNICSGETILAISDGMGSGAKASVDSRAAIELFEEFIEAGFDKKLAIKLINSSLILKSSTDSFTTLDACIIDLYTGLGQFMKVGATPSFIIRGQEVIKISNNSLPIGIVKDIDTEIITKQLRDGDIIILMSDGVLEIIKSHTEQMKWINQVLKSINKKEPQLIADKIIKSAIEVSQGIVQDDMTVVVGKVGVRV